MSILLLMSISVLVVEDDYFTRSTLTTTLISQGFKVPNPASNFKEALESFRTNRQQVLLTDLDLGEGPGGLDLANHLVKIKQDLGIVFLTSFQDPRFQDRKSAEIPAGAEYLIKQSLIEISEIKDAILSALTAGDSPSRAPTKKFAAGLTEAQIETVQMVAAGLSNSEIAKRRFVSEKAVEKTIKSLAEHFDLAMDSSKNLRVSMARMYLKLTGGKG